MVWCISDVTPVPETPGGDKELLDGTANGVVDNTFEVGDSLDGSTISPIYTLAVSSAVVENIVPAAAEDSLSVVSTDIVMQDASPKLPPAASATAAFTGFISNQSVPGSNRTETLPSLPESAQGTFATEVANSQVTDIPPVRSGSPLLIINKNAVILSDVNQNGTSAFLGSVNLEDPVSRLDSSKSQRDDSQVNFTAE